MTTLQQQARALGDPTRHRIFRFIADAGGRVGVAELTEHFGLNHNAIRQHLSKLVDAGLLDTGTAPTGGRGRPRLWFEVAPDVEARWGVESPYERLSAMLAEMLSTGDTAVEVGRRSGLRTPESAIDQAAADPVAVLVEEMARQGFDPAISKDDGSIEVTLRNCPFASAAERNPSTVCGLHLGIARGVADLTGGIVIEELEPHDPYRAGCRLRLHLESEPPDDPSNDSQE